MKKRELVKAVQSSLGKGATVGDAADAVTAVLKAISYGVKRDGAVQIAGFGTFKIRRRAARMGRSLQTGEPMPIKASQSIGFIPSAILKKTLAE